MAKVQEITQQIDKLTGRKESIPAELAGVRDKLAAAKTDLGRASLDGKTTDRVRAKVAELVGQEAELAAVLSAVDGRLVELGADLEDARLAELVKMLQDTDAKLMDEGEKLLTELYALVDRCWDLASEHYSAISKIPGKTSPPTGPLEMGVVAELCRMTYSALLPVLGRVETGYSLGGRPARFGKLIQANRWKHVKR